MKSMKLFVSVIGVLIMCVALSYPCGAAEPAKLKIGIIDSLTGWMAPIEGPSNQGARLAVDYINEKGGITVKGVKYKIELIGEDGKSSPDGVAAACTKLVEKDKVKFISGGVGTAMDTAASSVTEPSGVLRLGNYASPNPQEAGPQFPLTFYVYSSVHGMKAMLTYLKENHPEVKTLAITHPGDGGGQYRKNALEPIAKELGMSIVYSEEWPGETVDFTPFIKKALTSKADALFFTDGMEYHVGSQIKAARSLGFKGPIGASQAIVLSTVMGFTGPEMAEGFATMGWDLTSSAMPPSMTQEFLPRAKAKYGDKALNWQLGGWTNIMILTQAIKASQSLDPVVVAKYLRTTKGLDTPFGPAVTGGEKTYGIKSVVCMPQAIFVAKGGKPVFVKWIKTETP
jgi:branched-chain amino acid transport system substrate-binding protein